MQDLNQVHLLPKNEVLALPDNQELVIDDALLEQLVSSYDPSANHEAPVVLGHMSDDPESLPKHDGAPSHGWVKKLYTGPNGLYGDLEISDELADWIDEKKYKKLSVSFYTPGAHLTPSADGSAYLRHLAILGAAPPVVKGLEQYSLSINTEEGNISMVRDLNEAMPEQENQAETWLKVLLNYGDRGYKDNIVKILPKPGPDNNYLVDGNSIKGQFMNDDEDLFNFIIKRNSDGSFTRSFKLSPKADGEMQTVSELAEEMTYYEPEAEPTAQLLAELETTMKKLNEDMDTYVTDEEIIENQDALNDAMAPEDEELLGEEVMEQEPMVDMGEYKKLMEDNAKMKDENKRLKMFAESMMLSEIKAYTATAYEEGKMLESVLPQADMVTFLSTLQKIKQPIELSEGKAKSSLYDLAKTMISNMPNLIELSEIASAEETKAPEIKPGPLGTVNDPDSAKLHADVISLCESRKQDYKDPVAYKTALIEVINNVK